MNELTKRNDNNVVTQDYVNLPSEHEMQVFTTIAKQAADSKMYTSVGDQSGIMMTILAARELGIPPMLALNGGINNIRGKLEISARLMNAMMRRAGISIKITELTHESCELIGTRPDGDTAKVSYTLAEARKAGLVKSGGGWERNPKDMLFARCISRLARQIAPDIIGGCYIEGEIRATDSVPEVPKDVDVEIIEEESCDQLLEKYLANFDKEEQHHANTYLKMVMEHFDWTQINALKELLKVESKELLEKFNKWMERQSQEKS